MADQGDPKWQQADRSRRGARRVWLRRRLQLVAYLIVIVALIVLAVTPALLLERIVAPGRQLVGTVLPVHERLGEIALTMYQQSISARGYLLTREDRYVARLDSAQAVEARMLRELEPLTVRIGPAAVEHLSALQRLSLTRYGENALLTASDAGVAEYRAMLPRLESLRDSMLMHLAGIEGELRRVAEAGAAERERAAGLQRSLSISLGAVALASALLVGSFAWRQRLLISEIEEALTAANRLRTESERRREELERVTESRARLMRGFSHDVKNPLGAARGHLELISEGVLGPVADSQHRSLERARSSITAALNLVDDLLELARAESGHLEVARVPTEIGEVVEDAAEEYRAQTASKGLRLDVQVPESIPRVSTDGARVRQVLGNLLSNAVKYTREGAVTIRVEAPDDGAEPGRLAIHVTDTGPGIPEEQRAALFEEFVRLDPSAGPGAGVGLTISRRIAEALGGEITVQSEKGRGSTFTLWLPA